MRLLVFSLGGQDINPPGCPGPNCLPSGGLLTLNTIVQNGINIFIVVAVIFALVFIVLAGFDWVKSGGDKTKLASARAKLTYAIVGLIVVLLSFFIVKIVSYFFNTPVI